MSILLKFLAFPAFILGVAVARFIASIQRRNGRALAGRCCCSLLLIGFMVCGIAATPVQSPTAAG
jgi:hypothetical protein